MPFHSLELKPMSPPGVFMYGLGPRGVIARVTLHLLALNGYGRWKPWHFFRSLTLLLQEEGTSTVSAIHANL